MYLENNTQVKLLGYCCNETIKGKNNYWYKIDLDGKKGWVFGSQLRFLDEKFNKAKNTQKRFKRLDTLFHYIKISNHIGHLTEKQML